MKVWGEILGVNARYEEVSIEQWDKEIPGGLGIELAEMMAFSAEFGPNGGDAAAIHPKDVSVSFVSFSRAERLRSYFD